LRTEDARIEPLIRDLLDWLGRGERRYEDVMEAWRTSCPQLPVWEEANDRGYVDRCCIDGRSIVRLTPSGRNYLNCK